MENGWPYHKHLQIWQHWQIKPCLHCLNKFTIHQQASKYQKYSTNKFTSSDVTWIPLNQISNLCQRCTAETQNDPDQRLNQLEAENQWRETIIDIEDIKTLPENDNNINFISQILTKDTARQKYGTQDDVWPSLLEVESILVQQVEKIPVDMIGRIKIILNQVLYNINHVAHMDIDAQRVYLTQLKMIWKIIT